MANVKAVNFGQGIAAYNLSAVSFADGEIGGLQLTSAGLLKVDLSGNSVGVAGGTSYTEGDVDTTITGTAIMWEDTGDTMRAVSAAKPLPVDLQDASVAVTQSGTWNVGTVTTLTSITNVVQVGDNGGSITIDGTVAISGTVTVAAHAVTNAGTFAVQVDGAALTALQAIDVDVTTIIGHVDGIEALLTTISGNVDGIETLLTTIDGRVDGIEALLTSIEGDTTAIQAAVQIMDDWDNAASDGASISGDVAHDAVDAGEPVKIGGRASGAPITAVAANDRVDAFLDLQGRQITAQKAATGTISAVASSATSVTVLAANTARLGATIWNDSTAILYLRFGATASSANCTVKLIADAFYEVPFGYTGIIDGIWASVNGNARVTEIT